MKKWFFLALLLWNTAAHAQVTQDKNDWKKVYRSFAEKNNDLVHTRLEATLLFDKSQLAGKATITLQPHFYPTDSVVLDAKGMDIQSVSLLTGNSSQALQYLNDGMFIRIRLNKVYQRNQPYTLQILYTA